HENLLLSGIRALLRLWLLEELRLALYGGGGDGRIHRLSAFVANAAEVPCDRRRWRYGQRRRNRSDDERVCRSRRIAPIPLIGGIAARRTYCKCCHRAAIDRLRLRLLRDDRTSATHRYRGRVARDRAA